MVKWAAIGCAIQFILLQVMRRLTDTIESGNTAAGLLLACLSVSTGMLVALCIS